MTQETDLLHRLPALGVERALELLEQARAQHAGGKSEGAAPPPPLTLVMHGGHRVYGDLVSYTKGTGGRGAALLVRDADGRGRLDATYIDPQQVVAITIHHRSDTLWMHAEGALRAPLGTVPTRLGLKRQLQELSTRLAERAGTALPVEVAWEALPTSDLVHDALGSLVRDLDRVFGEVLGDDMGKAAVAERISGISVVLGADAGASLVDRRLLISVARQGADDVKSLDAAGLRDAINAVL